MLLPEIEEALNEQLNKEMYSAYLYLAMASYFEAQVYSGMAHWMKIQAKEELGHAMKYYNYVFQRGGVVNLKTIDAPPTTWDNALVAFEDAYNHEKTITSDIHQLMNLAISHQDHATVQFLQWFVAEQVEEEASASEIVHKLKRVGDDNTAGLMIIDRDLASRA